MLSYIKKAAVAAIAVTAAASAPAQTMTVNLKDGTSVNYDCDKVESVKMTPPEAERQFDIEVSDITATTAHLSVIPADNGIRYYYDVCTKAQFDQYGIEYIVNDYISYMQSRYSQLSLEQILDALLAQGPDEDDLTGLPADTDMEFYVIAVNERGQCVGQGESVSFRTLAPGAAADCTFGITYTGVSSEGLTININPSDTGVRYWAGVFSADMWPGDSEMTYMVRQSIDEVVAENNMTLEQVVERITYTGPATFDESGLQNGTRYYIYAYAMDAQGNAAGDVTKVMFTTAKYDYSDAEVRASYRYFNGDELAELYPDRFTKAKGRVVMQVVMIPGETAANFVWGLAAGDLSDEDKYPEDATKNAVLQGGYIDTLNKELIINYGTATLVYYAADQWGLDGLMTRKVIEVTEAGAMPADEYSAFEAPATVKPMIRLRANDETGKAAVTKQLRQRKAAIKQYRADKVN